MKSTLISIALIYTLCCLMLFVLQRKFLYMPPSAISIPAGVEPGVVDIGFDADGARLQGWLLNGGQTKALLYYGGNAESVEYNLDQFRSLLPDYSVYLIPYRGYGPSSGSPSEKKLYTDALQVYDAVQGQYAEVALMGRSLGSGVATFVASRREVTRLVLVTPYDSIENLAQSIYWMFPVRWLLWDKYRSLERVADISASTTVIYAERDEVIPEVRTLSLVQAFDGRAPRVVSVTGAGHNNISVFPQYGLALRQALD
jgi:pimeloyl-ACP methyl ester carboxylesterase